QDYLVKGTDNSRLIQALRYAIARVNVQNSRISGASGSIKEGNTSDSRKFQRAFTERELQILKLLGRGCSNTEISQQLTIANTTVKSHVSSILTKLSVSDRTKAAVEAVKQGLL